MHRHTHIHTLTTHAYKYIHTHRNMIGSCMLMFHSNITTVHTQTYLFSFLYNSTMTELEYFGNCMSNTPRADRRQTTVVSCLTGREGQGRERGGREERGVKGGVEGGRRNGGREEKKGGWGGGRKSDVEEGEGRKTESQTVGNAEIKDKNIKHNKN